MLKAKVISVFLAIALCGSSFAGTEGFKAPKFKLVPKQTASDEQKDSDILQSPDFWSKYGAWVAVAGGTAVSILTYVVLCCKGKKAENTAENPEAQPEPKTPVRKVVEKVVGSGSGTGGKKRRVGMREMKDITPPPANK